MEETRFNELKPNVVLGIAAHPDDLDFGSSGTMAKFASEGADVYYLILTDGSSGTEDRTIKPEALRDIRREEQRNAGKIIGLKDVFFCDFPDGALQNTLEVKREVVKIIRKVKPDIAIAMDPSLLYSAKRGFINHPDHRAAGQAALDAIFPLARDHMAFPELLAGGYEPHKTKTVLLTNFDTSNYAVDVTDTLDLKFRAIAAHVSQVPKDITPMRARFTEWAAKAGEPYGYKYAETFMRIDVQ
jgi:LmbE family N-acetylglucosaminyl deacetylase